MALSQKHEGKCLVPWFCSAEWHCVYNKIFGTNNNEKTRREALDIISIWKSRTPFIARGVEGTYIILEAVLIDRNVYNDHNLKLLLSTLIMRFLNICAAYNKYQGTFYATAYKMKIPEWLISLRHEVAHGQNLPSMDILERALKFSLEWLHQEYWKATAPDIKDFIDDTQFQSDKAEMLRYSLQQLVSNYCYVTLLTHSKWNYKKIQDISDKEMRTVFLEEIKTMTGFNDISNSTEISRVLQFLWQQIANILNEHEDLENRYHVLAELIIEDVFLGNIDDREDIFKNSEEVPKDFITLWKDMFMNFGTEMIGALMESLLNSLTLANVSHESKIVAATWLEEIGMGLEKCMFKKNILKRLSKTGPKPQKIIQSVMNKQLYEKYRKNIILNLNTDIVIPDVVSDCSKFKKLILNKPTIYTKIFITELLDLNETFKLPYNREKILELMYLYIMNENDSDDTTTITEIHKVEELDPTAMDIDDQEIEKIQGNTEFENSINRNVNGNTPKIWRRATETNFAKCPIGILPWQSISMNPLMI